LHAFRAHGHDEASTQEAEMDIVAAGPPIGFSTLGCPAWRFSRVVEQADEWGAEVLEIRFFNGRTIGPDVPLDQLRDARAALRAARVKACTLATGVELASGMEAVDDLNRLIGIAAELGCRQLRVFPGGSEGVTDTAMRKAVDATVDRAADHDVVIGVETHDSMKSGRAVARLVAATAHPAFGIIWDTVHTSVAGETPADTWSAIAPHVIEVQVKDARFGPPMKPVLLGAGDVKWRHAVAIACETGFRGPLMLEWEKAWHPDLAEPEVAIPLELAALRAELRHRPTVLG
jgi:sugar phosphate isomerase/epimerase